MNKVALTIETYGFEGLEKTFDNFYHKDKKSIFNAAFRKATLPMVEAARQNAPIGKTGNLRKSIGAVPIRESVGIWVGARVIGGYKGAHGHLVEDGTLERFYITRKGVRHNTGRMPVMGGYAGFFRRAVEDTKEQAIDSLTTEWHKAIARFIVRTKNKDR
jgi:HK97 gp10 family phage protein